MMNGVGGDLYTPMLWSYTAGGAHKVDNRRRTRFSLNATTETLRLNEAEVAK